MFILAKKRFWAIIILFFTFLLFIALSAFLFRKAAIEILQNEEKVFLNRVSSVELLTGSTSSTVMMLNGQIQFSLENRDSIAFADFEILPGWDDYYGTWRLNISQKKVDMFGNRSINDFSSDDWEEIQAIRYLGGMFEDIDSRVNNLAYLYYLSERHFVVIAPPPPQMMSEKFDGIYNCPFWTEAIPENNLEKRMIVTSAYADPGGLGKIITLSCPVMANGVFRGVTCMDITLGTLNRSLTLGSSFGKTSVFDEGLNEIFSNSKLIFHKAGETKNFWGEFSGNYNSREKHFVFNHYLVNRELLLQHTLSNSLLMRKALEKIMSSILNFVAVIILLFLLFHLYLHLHHTREETIFIRRLIRIIGHDLQTPLSVSLQALEMLENEYIPEAATLAKQSLSSAVLLLRDLSFWGKSRTKEIKVNKLSYPINTAVEQAVNPVRSITEMKKITLELHLEDSAIELDQNIFSTVLRNLVSNAAKFTPAEGRIVISGHTGKKGLYLLSVKDSGVGMREDQIHDFRKNKSLKSEAGTRGEKGTGFGLSLVRSLCSQVGWPISVESVPNEGTVFTIAIPK